MSQPKSDPSDPYLGRIVDGCLLTRKLSPNKAKLAYLGVHIELDRPFYLKLLVPSIIDEPDELQRFYRSAQSLAKLKHPNITAIANVGLEEEIHFLRLEYLDGVSLESEIQSKQRLPWRSAAAIVAKVASGLGHAHGLGLVHREITPHNILVKNTQPPYQTTASQKTAGQASGQPIGANKGKSVREGYDAVKITGFGLSKAVVGATSVSKVGEVLGRPFFMSPEQAGGKATDARSDIYSLGVTLYYMITGIKPFSGKNLQEVFLKHFFYNPESPKVYAPDLPDALGEIIRRALKKKKRERYQSSQQLADNLSELLEQEGG